MSSGFPIALLSNCLIPVERPEAPILGKIYRQIGVRLWGEGAYERESIDGSQTKYSTLSRVEANDIVVNKIWARNGSVAVISASLAGCYGSGEFPTFTPILEKLDPRWFHWFTKTKAFWQQCDKKSQGTSGKNRIRPEKFLEISIPLPSPDEQRRIVARIEELASRIEEARGLRKEAVVEGEVFISVATNSIFEKLDAKCAIYPLTKLAQIFGGGTPSKANYAFWQGTIPWVSPKDMKVREIYDTEDHVSDLVLQSGVSTLIPKNSVLIVVRSGILRRTLPVAINRIPVTINQDMKALIPVEGILSDYLAWWFKGRESQFLEAVKGGTTVQSVMWDKASKINVCVPSIEEQQDVITYLDSLQAKVDALKQLQAETTAELDALLPSVLDKAFKGEL